MRPNHVLQRNSLSLSRHVLTLAAAIALAGCAASGPQPQQPPAVQSLEQTLQEAAQAAAAGQREQARGLYRTAAKAHPAAKEPWLRLAEDHFEAGEHGQAILAAQEALQRDPADPLATGVVAMSGLRVSNSALTTLRQQHNTLGDGTRAEAQDFARVLRDVLGEPAAAPAPAAVQATARPVPVTAGRPKPAARRAPAATPPVAAASPVAAAAPVAGTAMAAAPAAPIAVASAAPASAPRSAARSADDPFRMLGK